MATIKNAKSSCNRTVLYMELNNVEFTICSLITEKLEQQVLNLKIQKGAQLKIRSNGPNAIQLLGTYYMDQNSTKTKHINPLEQLSKQTAPGENDDIYYYPMTKEEHTSLVEYNSEAAIAEREDFIGKFGIVMDILDSIENPQPIIDNFISKYKKRGLEDIENILSPKKVKKTTTVVEKEKKNKPKNTIKKSVQDIHAKKPVQVANKKKPVQNDNTKKPVQNANTKKTNNKAPKNKKYYKNKKKQDNNAQKTPPTPSPKEGAKKKESKINVPQ
ncbi:hypothetical protein K501DRAFT_99969 [Backusella circina FSU 941]|nr:hypothetical protein K501DRAFT_99969 [Backusella circina FSU 941]